MIRRKFLQFIGLLPIIKQPSPTPQFIVHNNFGKLSDIHISNDDLKGIKRWRINQIDEQTRREIYSGGFYGRIYS